MRKLTGLLALVSVFTYSAVVSATEKIVVERSPFAEAFFMIQSSAHGLGGGLDAAKKKGEEDATVFGVDSPNGSLEFGFSKVVRDVEMMKPESRIFYFTVEWNLVEIRVDSNERGMAISYERLASHGKPEKVVIHVPSELDKKLWLIKAERFYAQYKAAFWEKKHVVETARKKAGDEAAILMKTLQQGTILVFPKD